jgi:DNA-directed RNA polymerase specialized sigma24 family protein
MSASSGGELFEPTPRTAMVALLQSQRRDEVEAFLMRTYARPLAMYLSATSYRSLGKPDDLVAGFFACRLGRKEWLAGWAESGLRLRRWLVNGLLFYLREEIRRRSRDRREVTLPEDAPPASLDLAYEQAYAREVVKAACDAAAAICAADGFERHWAIFLRHFVDGRTYEELAQESDLTVGQVNGMARTALTRFRRAMSDLLLRDGADPADLDREIGELLLVLGGRSA